MFSKKRRVNTNDLCLILCIIQLTSSIIYANRPIVFLPFQGYRAHQYLQNKIICPPYNFLNLQDSKEFAYNNKYSFLHISRPEVDLPTETVPYTQTSGLIGKQQLELFIKKGWLIQDQKPCFYIYEQTIGSTRSIGIIGLIAIQHYANNTIKRHEETILEKEKAITIFTNLEQAHIDPVVLTYRSNITIDQLLSACTIAPPTQKFIAIDGSFHKLWAISNQDLTKDITNAFEQVTSLYIADGHHRSAAAYHLQQQYKSNDPYTITAPHNFYLAALIPDNKILLTSYNRIIQDLNNHTRKDFLKKLERYFFIKKVAFRKEANPQKAHTFGMFLDNEWYTLQIKKLPTFLAKKNNIFFCQLDMSILNEIILEPILGIKSLSNYNRIECISGSLGLKKLEDACKKRGWQLGFALSSLSIDTFIDVVDQGFLMPPKTTWFEPKMWQGLVIRKLD